nr:MAG TPA: hypothetical protein [Bacteriophage sp.]
MVKNYLLLIEKILKMIGQMIHLVGIIELLDQLLLYMKIWKKRMRKLFLEDLMMIEAI